MSAGRYPNRAIFSPAFAVIVRTSLELLIPRDIEFNAAADTDSSGISSKINEPLSVLLVLSEDDIYFSHHNTTEVAHSGVAFGRPFGKASICQHRRYILRPTGMNQV